MAVVEYKKEGRTATFIIKRPEARNAINLQVRRELSEALKDFRDDNELWVGIVTGAGQVAFSAGADIKEIPSSQCLGRVEGPVVPMRGFEIWKPLIAAINGFALGAGLELALACDIRIASESATFGMPEVTIGLIPGWGGTQRLSRMVPWCKAAEMLFTGQRIDAQEAYRIGLVNKVVPSVELMSAANQLAGTICKAAPLAVRSAKEAMIRGTSVSFEEGLRIEMGLAEYLLTTEDAGEGSRSFVEKRPPVYKAR